MTDAADSSQTQGLNRINLATFNIRTLKGVELFKYLGHPLSSLDPDWLAVYFNLKKARKRWARVSRVLTWEGATFQESAECFTKQWCNRFYFTVAKRGSLLHKYCTYLKAFIMVWRAAFLASAHTTSRGRISGSTR
jgi:hypothetical protein